MFSVSASGMNHCYTMGEKSIGFRTPKANKMGNATEPRTVKNLPSLRQLKSLGFLKHVRSFFSIPFSFVGHFATRFAPHLAAASTKSRDMAGFAQRTGCSTLNLVCNFICAHAVCMVARSLCIIIIWAVNSC